MCFFTGENVEPPADQELDVEEDDDEDVFAVASGMLSLRDMTTSEPLHVLNFVVE